MLLSLLSTIFLLRKPIFIELQNILYTYCIYKYIIVSRYYTVQKTYFILKLNLILILLYIYVSMYKNIELGKDYF